MAGGTQRGSGSGRLILASASPRRRELLRQIGLEPEIAVSLVEEKAQGTPEEVVKELSRQKAGEVARRLGIAGAEDSSSIVIGADTVVAVDGRILGKPADRGEAAAMLGLLQGRTHLVCTGVTLIGGGAGGGLSDDAGGDRGVPGLRGIRGQGGRLRDSGKVCRAHSPD